MHESSSESRISSETRAARRLALRGGMLEAMWIGWIEFDLLLGDVQSLKEKRAIVRPLIADLSRRTEAAVAEVASHDLHRRAGIGVSVVASAASHVRDVLDRAERTVVDHPEVTLLSAHRGLHSSED